MNIAIIHTPSPGLKLDARIIADALAEAIAARNARVLFIEVPVRALEQPADVIRRQFPIDAHVDVAIFLERILNHPVLQNARHRILVPNPEWLFGQSAHQAGRCTEFWHKSRFSQELLSTKFPQARHRLTGFSSLDPGFRVRDHSSFLHLRGNLATRRHSGPLVELWQEHPEWPDLHLQFHGNDLDINMAHWLSRGNIHLRLGWMAEAEYKETAANHGIHICTSEHEGFGHYINEARAMAALVVTTDAPPMNELVDTDSGILVKPETSYTRAYGQGFRISKAAMAAAIEHVLALSPEQRREMGMNARDRFEKDRTSFNQLINDVFSSVF